MVIDTLIRTMPGVDQKIDGGIYGEMLGSLQCMAQKHNTAIVFVDHTRKPSGMTADPVDDILHTTEKTAIADMIFALYQVRGKAGATPLGRGRDIEGVNLSLEWHGTTSCWQVTGQITSERDNEILSALETLNRSRGGDIARATGQNKGNVHTRLIKVGL